MTTDEPGTSPSVDELLRQHEAILRSMLDDIKAEPDPFRRAAMAAYLRIQLADRDE